MQFAVPFKSLVIRYLPEAILRPIRKTHYARKLAAAEPEPEIAVLRHLAPPGGCALDLGANFGLYTRFLARAVGPAGLVHAVEPIPAMYEVLRSNVRRLGLSNVLTHRLAVSDVTRTVVMTVPRYATGGCNFYEARIGGGGVDRAGKPVLVSAALVDDLFADLPRVDVIKCDVEGHELQVLKGAVKTIRRHRPAWLIEVSGDPDRPGSTAPEVVRWMRGEGYEIYHFDGCRLRPRRKRERAVNYFFLLPEHLGRLPASVKESTSGHTIPA